MIMCLLLCKKICILASIILIGLNSAYPKALGESLGFVEIRGSFEKLSWNSTSWSTAGGGFSLCLNFVYPIYLEAYLDYLYHINPLNNIDSPLVTSKSMNSMHIGGKTVLVFSNMFLIKAGIGIANIKSQINNNPTSGNDLEMNFSAGMFYPLTTHIDVNLIFIFRRLFESPAVNLLGGSAGLMLKF